MPFALRGHLGEQSIQRKPFPGWNNALALSSKLLVITG